MEVFRFAYFRSGVAFKRKAGIRSRHAAAVVNDLDEAASCFLNDELDVVGAGIYGVFQQFFYYRCRSLHDFTGGDLVGNGFG